MDPLSFRGWITSQTYETRKSYQWPPNIAYLDLAYLDLSGCDFRGVDLNGVDMRSSNVDGVDFRGVDLGFVDLRDIAGTPLTDESTVLNDDWESVTACDPDHVTRDGSGNIIEQAWVDAEGRYHRNNGPALETFSVGDDGVVTKRKSVWYQHGDEHRVGGSSSESWNAEGELLETSYRKYGVLHREDGPAATAYARDGGDWVKYENWIVNGLPADGVSSRQWLNNSKLLREERHLNGLKGSLDAPAEREWNRETGELVSEQWMLMGQVQRQDDLPARTLYHADGKTPSTVGWIQPGRGVHRDGDKPALVQYYENGNIREARWMREGVEAPNSLGVKLIHYSQAGQPQSALIEQDKNGLVGVAKLSSGVYQQSYSGLEIADTWINSFRYSDGEIIYIDFADPGLSWIAFQKGNPDALKALIVDVDKYLQPPNGM
jgi:hypothetical protein